MVSTAKKTALFSVYGDNQPEFQKRIYKKLSETGVTVLSADVSSDPDSKRLHFVLTIELPSDMNEESIVSEYPGSSIIQNT